MAAGRLVLAALLVLGISGLDRAREPRTSSPDAVVRSDGSSLLDGVIIDEALIAEARAGLDPVQQELVGMLAAITRARFPETAPSGDAPRDHMDLIFAPGTPDSVVQAYQAYFDQHGRYQGTARWTTTATQPGPLGQGDPTSLTWNFVADGTAIGCSNDMCGVMDENNADPSNVQAFFNNIYTNAAARDAVFDQVFATWSALTGLTITRVNFDDGVEMGSQSPGAHNAGIPNTRADLRIGGRLLDGPSMVLAYNYFPENGDMVFDTGDDFYSGDGLANDSLGTRNVISHEHGHGLGMAHVDPVDETKLMEPFVSTMFDGPQFDDILGGQRRYGDPDEKGTGNDTVALATALGNLGDGTTTRNMRSIDDASATDVDYYSFTVPVGKKATVTMTPGGLTYLQGPQAGPGVPPPELYSPQSFIDLDVALLGTDGVTQLALGNTQPAGVAETTGEVLLPSGGTFFVHVFRHTAGVADAQMYKLDIDIVPQVFTLTVAGSGNGTGTLAGSGINCTSTAGTTAGTCTQGPVAYGSMFALTATASASSAFVSWMGCDSTSITRSFHTCNVTLTADRTVTAAFVVPVTITGSDLLVGQEPTRFTLDAGSLDFAFQARASRSYCVEITNSDDGRGTSLNLGNPRVTVFSDVGAVNQIAANDDAATEPSGTLQSRACFVTPAISAPISGVIRVEHTAPVPPATVYYQLRVIETTLWASWFFQGADYNSFVLMRNTTDMACDYTIWWRDPAGTIIGSSGPQTVAAHAGVGLNSKAFVPLGSINGTVAVTHTCSPEALVGQLTSLSAGTGLNFDSSLFQRRPW